MDFTSILNKPADSVERPKPIPAGTYRFVVTKYEFGKVNNEKQTPYVRFHCKPLEPKDDVDMDLLAQSPKWNEREMRLDQYATEDSLWRLTEFLEKHLQIEASGRTIAQMLEEAPGRTFLGGVVHTPNKKQPDSPPYANIDSTAPDA